jgi:hypothetical protein
MTWRAITSARHQVEGASAPPPEALGGSDAKRDVARRALTGAQTRLRRVQEERKLAERQGLTLLPISAQLELTLPLIAKFKLTLSPG